MLTFINRYLKPGLNWLLSSWFEHFRYCLSTPGIHRAHVYGVTENRKRFIDIYGFTVYESIWENRRENSNLLGRVKRFLLKWIPNEFTIKNKRKPFRIL